MAFYQKYYPDYQKLYPGEMLSPELIKAVRKSDRERKRIEYDLKYGKPIYRNAVTGFVTDKDDPDAIIADSGQPREVSLEVLFSSGEKVDSNALDEYADPLSFVIRKERIDELYRCLATLAIDELRLIEALYWYRVTESEYAKRLGVRQTTINYRKHCILKKLKKRFGKP